MAEARSFTARARSEEPDAQTLAACRRGDRDALERVLRLHAPALERVLTRMVGASPDVADLLQATLLSIARAFPTFRGEASLSTWMTRIAVRVALAHLRHPDRRRARAGAVVAVEEIDPAPPADRVVDARRRLERLTRHLEAIGPKKRVAFVLHVFEGHSIAEVAALVGASEMATKSRIFFARRELLRRVRKDPHLRDSIDEQGAR